ncbi:MAG: PAS domain S-box protein [Firmicutes bacterium]|nr:PAS domain S-box protein [Bacillota bacterium]
MEKNRVKPGVDPGELDKVFGPYDERKMRQPVGIHELEILNRIIAATNDSGDSLLSPLEKVLEMTLELLGFECGEVYLLDERSGTAELVCTRNLDPEQVKLLDMVPAKMEPYSKMLVDKQLAIFTEDPSNTLEDVARVAGIQAAVSIPIVSVDQVIGAINAASRNRYSFSSEEKLILLSIGQVVGTFVEKARIMESLREEKQLLTTSIAELKATGEALRKSEQRLRSYFDQPLVGVVIASPVTGWIAVNDRFCGIVGYTWEELQAVKWEDLTPPEDLEREMLQYDRIIRGETDGYSLEKHYIKKDGSLVDIEISTACVRKEDGSVDYFVGLIQDITERKGAEEKIALAAEIFERSAVGMAVTNADRVIQRVNPAFVEITGYSEEEVVGRDIRTFEMVRTDQPIQYFDEMGNSIEEKGRFEGTVWKRRKNGEVYLEDFIITEIRGPEGKIEQYVRSIRDITEEVKLREEKVRLQDQIARMSRVASLGALSGGIVHEITQPLNAIKVISDGLHLLYKKDVELGKEKMMENMIKISRLIDRVDDTIRHIRSFANGIKRYELKPCGLNQKILEVLEMLNWQFSAHRISIRRELAEDLKMVTANENGLEEIITNLLVNAITALDTTTKAGKEIVCRTRNESGSVAMEICDNATGINDEIRDDIFEPLFSTKKSSSNMGLGLAIVKYLVESFNGTIVVYNNEAGGATFRVVLPADGG